MSLWLGLLRGSLGPPPPPPRRYFSSRCWPAARYDMCTGCSSTVTDFVFGSTMSG